MLWIIGFAVLALFLNNVRRSKNGKVARPNSNPFPHGKASEFDPYDITKERL